MSETRYSPEQLDAKAAVLADRIECGRCFERDPHLMTNGVLYYCPPCGYEGLPNPEPSRVADMLQQAAGDARVIEQLRELLFEDPPNAPVSNISAAAKILREISALTASRLHAQPATPETR